MLVGASVTLEVANAIRVPDMIMVFLTDAGCVVAVVAPRKPSWAAIVVQVRCMKSHTGAKSKIENEHLTAHLTAHVTNPSIRCHSDTDQNGAVAR